ncbi:MAG: polysaccharide biosynthesis C-terminal domain-containing protein [Porphyromonas sp.]|nr:polysaccharide biosynthesis C-terminal domain-containing protein [Porphyromonas sp.]
MGVVFRQSLKGTVTNLIGAGIGFVSTFFVITRLLTPEEIGLTRVLVEAATLIGGYALLATQSSSIRYYPHFKSADGRDGGFLRLLLGIPLVGLILFGILYLVLRPPLESYFAPDTGSDLFARYYYTVLPLMLFIMYQTVLEVYCSLKQRIVIPKMSREVVLRLLLLTAYIVYGAGWVTFDRFIGLFIVSYGLMMVITLRYALKITPGRLGTPVAAIPQGLKRDFAVYTSFTVLSALGGSVVQRLDLFMVSAELGMASAGIYTIAFFVVAVIEMPSRSLSTMSSPFASEAIHKGDTHRLNHIFRQVSGNQLLVGILLLLAIWVNIDTLFWVIPNGSIYSEGKWVVLFLGLGKLIDLTFSFGNAILRYSKHYFWTLAYTVIVLAVTILLNLYLIRLWGMSGAAVATLITYALSYAFQQLVLWRKMKVSPVNKEMALMLLIFAVLMVADSLLPHWGAPLVDSVWRSIVIGIFGWILFGKLPTFRQLVAQSKAAIGSITKRN